MDCLFIYILILIGLIIIDLSIRLPFNGFKITRAGRPMGLFGLIVLSLRQQLRPLKDSDVTLRRCYLSLLMLIFIASANFLLLYYGIPSNINLMQFGLILSPLFILPFYHFLYDLFAINPLSTPFLIRSFRLRGSMSLIVASNSVFITMESSHNIFSYFAHFLLALSGLFSVVYLCQQIRVKPSSLDIPAFNGGDPIESLVLHYICSLLETFYYISVIYLSFIFNPINTEININYTTGILPIYLCIIIIVLVVKLKPNINTYRLLRFSEERALPGSFLLFGISSFIRYYV